MGRGDSRKSLKMRRIQAQRHLKERMARRAILVREARSQQRAAAGRPQAPAPSKPPKKG